MAGGSRAPASLWSRSKARVEASICPRWWVHSASNNTVLMTEHCKEHILKSTGKLLTMVLCASCARPGKLRQDGHEYRATLGLHTEGMSLKLEEKKKEQKGGHREH